MSLWTAMLIGAWTTIVGVWAYILYQQFLIPRLGIMLRARPAELGPPDGLARWPSVCVVIAARNESENVEACLESVLANDYPNLSVRVVDDRSEDDTVALAERIAARDRRVSVQRIEDLPAGWMGKSHALWRTTRDLEADWLLFLDADCRLEPAAVSTVIAEACRRKVDLLSLWPRHDSRSFWEHLIIPLCGGVTALWFGSTKVNDPGSAKAFANGQFLLMARRAYESMGGHQTVRHALIEDVVFAEQAKAAGLSCWVGGGQALFSVRMYTSLAGIMSGWARIYVGALRSTWKLAGSVAWLLFGSLWPYFVLLALLANPETRLGGAPFLGMPTGWAASLGLLHLALILIVSYRFWGYGGCRRRYLWLYPLSVIIVTAVVLRAGWWLAVKRSVPWRNTFYRINSKGVIGAPIHQDDA